MEDENGILFILEGPLSIVGGIERKSMTMKDEKWEVLDRKALRTI